jgi:hypothetical protein
MAMEKTTTTNLCLPKKTSNIIRRTFCSKIKNFKKVTAEPSREHCTGHTPMKPALPKRQAGESDSGLDHRCNEVGVVNSPK